MIIVVCILDTNNKLVIIVRDVQGVGGSFVCTLSTPQVERCGMVVRVIVWFMGKLLGDCLDVRNIFGGIIVV